VVKARTGPAQPGGGGARWLFWPLLAFTLVLMVVLGVVVDAPLKTSAARMGIISYELAGATTGAQAILDAWNPRARAYAGFSLGLDYLYMPSYALTIGLACAWAARKLGMRWQGLGMLGLALAWGQALAALCDAVENVALTRMLLVAVAEPWPAVARWCATVKFALIIAGLIYSLAACIFWLAVRRAQRAA
jgi:hypothetical protein